jgi:hypothetical protein
MNLNTIDKKRFQKIEGYIIELNKNKTTLNDIIELVQWKFNEKIFEKEINDIYIKYQLIEPIIEKTWGCSSHLCYIEKPKGLGTNGPCSCLRGLKPEQKRKLLDYIDFLKNKD